MSRVSPAIAVGFSLNGTQLVAVLEQLKRSVGLPPRIAVDHGPECIAKALDAWADRNGVMLECSRPGEPTDHASVESFKGHVREEWLDQPGFVSVAESRAAIEAWRIENHAERPHRALKQRAPPAVQADWEKAAD